MRLYITHQHLTIHNQQKTLDYTALEQDEFQNEHYFVINR